MSLRKMWILALSASAIGAPVAALAATAGQQWTIGPSIGGRNYSRGMPARPSAAPDGWGFEFPGPGGKVNYVTFRHGSLAGKERITMKYRIEAAPGVRIVPASNPALPSMITLYFQRAGDNWSGRGRFETYRWYATFATQSPVTPGEHVITAPLGGNWTAVQSSSARSNPSAFRDALLNADQVGFVLGGGDGYGHGVFATGPARIVITDFRID